MVAFKLTTRLKGKGHQQKHLEIVENIVSGQCSVRFCSIILICYLSFACDKFALIKCNI